MNAVLVVAAIVLLGAFFADLPKATLAAIVIAAVIPLMRTGELRRLHAIDDVDFALAAVCLLGRAAARRARRHRRGGRWRRSWRSSTAASGRTPPCSAASARREATRTTASATSAGTPGSRPIPGSLVFRFDQEIFFANAMLFRDALRRAIAAAETPVEAVLVDAGAITHIDTTGLDMLRELVEELTARGIRLMLARVKSPVRETLERSGMVERLGEGSVTTSMRAGLESFLAGRPTPGARTGRRPPFERR